MRTQAQRRTSPCVEERLRGSQSIAGFAVSGFKLVQLCVPLGGEFALWRLAVEIGPRAVIKRGMEIDPDLGVWVALVLHGLRSFRDTRLMSIRSNSERSAFGAGLRCVAAALAGLPVALTEWLDQMPQRIAQATSITAMAR